MKNNAAIIALSGKGGVGKTSVSATIVKLLVEAYPDKKILAVDEKTIFFIKNLIYFIKYKWDKKR